MWVWEFYSHFATGWRWDQPEIIYVRSSSPGATHCRSEQQFVKTNAFWSIEDAVQVLLHEAAPLIAKEQIRLRNATTNEIIPLVAIC